MIKIKFNENNPSIIFLGLHLLTTRKKLFSEIKKLH